MALAEAQAAGACIVASAHQVPDQILLPEASIGYEAGDVETLVGALKIAKTRDPGRIREQALKRFAFEEVVARTRAAIGL